MNRMKQNSSSRLDLFDASAGLDRGRPVWLEALWYLVKCFVFLSPLPWPVGFKRTVLRAFGAKVGKSVNIKPRVNIHFPWKLELGDWCWLGEEVFILNFEPVSIGAHACVSQRAFLCGGNHDFRDPAFSFRNAPIHIGEGAWVGAQVFVGPGVTIASHAVVTAGSVVTASLPEAMICSGNPCVPLKPRWRSGGADSTGGGEAVIGSR
jgi:putative colanic acid biosynthesis acetyltransferase WcaF